MKTPEQYFEEQVFDLDQADKRDDLSSKEKSFVDKYLGGDPEDKGIAEVKKPSAEHPVFPERKKPAPEPELRHEASLEEKSIIQEPAAVPQKEAEDKIPVSRPESEPAGVPDRDAVPKKTEKGDREHLKSLDEVQLVSFFMGKQEYALPIEKVKEVIKYIQPTKIPSAPSYLDGVINLRQRVTPIVRLISLLRPGKSQDSENRFIVVCHHDGLQVGLLVESIATMYRMPKEDIEWNVESALAMGSSFVAALIKNREKIISILSIESIVNHLLAE